MGNNLSAILEARGLTAVALANRSHVAPSTITRIAKGEVEPSLRIAQRIALALGLGVNEVFPYVPTAGPQSAA